jgi:signal transduction histidine kinase
MTANLASTQTEAQWVVIVSDAAQFGRDLVERWQAERYVPEFTFMTSELWERSAILGEELSAASDPPTIRDYDYDLAIFGAVPAERLDAGLRLVPSGTPILAVLPSGVSPRQVRFQFPNAVPLRESDGALETAVMAGAELLRRSLFQKRLVAAERANHVSQSQAALGRYMLESRHNFNNALTSVLGTAELMQVNGLDPIDEARDQVKTIHMMALRMQALMQRFSSIETEMRMAERQRGLRAEVLQFQRRSTGDDPQERRP